MSSTPITDLGSCGKVGRRGALIASAAALLLAGSARAQTPSPIPIDPDAPPGQSTNEIPPYGTPPPESGERCSDLLLVAVGFECRRFTARNELREWRQRGEHTYLAWSVVDVRTGYELDYASGAGCAEPQRSRGLRIQVRFCRDVGSVVLRYRSERPRPFLFVWDVH